VEVEQVDHLVLTVRDIDATCAYYSSVLGMKVVEFAGGRKALSFGSQKINLHRCGSEFRPHAAKPTPGSADICLLTSMSIDDVVHHLHEHRVEIIEGPVNRTGAAGEIVSVYLRDPDGNLLEIANRLSTSDVMENHAT
jgi:catechol 2,3-dioxygenase-like lactoylglutathione lyase family enzyme